MLTKEKLPGWKIILTAISCAAVLSCASGPLKVYVPEWNKEELEVEAIRRDEDGDIVEVMEMEKWICQVFGDGSRRCLYIVISREDMNAILERCKK